MRKEISKKIRLGIFVIIGIAVLIIGIYFIGEGQQLFRKTFRITGTFSDVAGLQVGNNVRLSGVNVGVVDLISIVSDTTVRVEIVIDERVRKFIRKDAVISIGSDGLMGNKMLIITPGTGDKKVIENNDIVQTVSPMNLDDVFLSLKTSMDNTSQITGDLSLIISNVQSGEGTIGKLLMDQTLQQNIDSTVINLKEGTDGFNVVIKKAKNSWLLWGRKKK